MGREMKENRHIVSHFTLVSFRHSQWPHVEFRRRNLLHHSVSMRPARGSPARLVALAELTPQAAVAHKH